MKKRKQLSGGAKMKLAGRHPVMLGLPPKVLLLIQRAAELERRPVAQFVAYYAEQAAIKTIQQADNAEYYRTNGKQK